MADLKALAVDVIRAMTANDVAGMRRLMREDIVWRYPESSRMAGIDPIRRGLAMLLQGVGDTVTQTFRSLGPRVELVLRDGDHVTVLCALEGETVDGKAYDNQYVFIMRFVGDQVAEGWELPDTAQAFALLRSDGA